MAGDPAGGAEQAGRWLPPAVAADFLGVSERTLRRYVVSGKYSIQHAGRRVRIFIPNADAHDLGGAARAERAGSGPPSLALLRALDALNEALVAERSRSERLEARLQEINEQRLQLMLQVAGLQHGAMATEPPPRRRAAPVADEPRVQPA